jgi:hypothetical protein
MSPYKERYHLRENLQEWEGFEETHRRDWEAELRSYHEDDTF